MPNYPKIREEILKLLATRPLTNGEICDQIHTIIPEALSPDELSCPHTTWKQKEWQHEVRGAIDQLQDKGKITRDKRTHFYRLAAFNKSRSATPENSNSPSP